MMGQMGKILILAGGLLILVGIGLLSAGKIPWLGRLPGDIHIRGKHWTFYFPLATCILISIILTLVLWLISHFRGGR